MRHLFGEPRTQVHQAHLSLLSKKNQNHDRINVYASWAFAFFFCSTLRSRARLMWGRTPPKAMVARIRVSSSSSPRMASCRWRGVMRLTLRSLAAFYIRSVASVSSLFCLLGEIPGSSETACRMTHDDGDACTYACELEDFGSQVLEHGRDIDGSFGADAHLVLGVGLEEALDTTAGELASDKVSECVLLRGSFPPRREQRGACRVTSES